MAGLKAQIEKELKSLGVRKIEKQGYGTVSLGQASTNELLAALAKAKSNS